MTQLLAHLFGDYILQSDWMAQNKTKRSWPALAHALLYSLCFVPLLWVAAQHIPTATVPVVNSCPATAATTAVFTCSTVMVNTSMGLLPVAAAKITPPAVIPAYFRWLPWLVIFSTHFLIDRFRLARYVVWAKNWMGPRKKWYRCIAGGRSYWTDSDQEADSLDVDNYNVFYRPTPPLWACPTGYPPNQPPWLSTWLLIIADNTLHLTINYLALRYL